jgi:hypothetical protein
MSRLCLSFFIMTTVLNAQGPPPSDPQAITLAAQTAALLSGKSAVSDVMLNGTVTRIAGSDKQTGTVTLLAKGSGESRADLNLTGGMRSEIRNILNGLSQGNWIGVDGGVHAIAPHNCLTDAPWFFPALGTLAAVKANSSVVLSYVGLENLQQTSLQHIRSQMYNTSWPEAEQLSAMDFYLDSQTLLPTVVTFSEHADNDETVNVAVQVMFSDYRNINGATIPFHIQRYVNNSLVLDIQLTSAIVNSGIPDSQFKLQ